MSLNFVPQRNSQVGFVVSGSNTSIVSDYRSDQPETYFRFFSTLYGSNTGYLMGTSNTGPGSNALILGQAVPAGTTFRPNTEFVLTQGRIGIGTGARTPMASLHISNSNTPVLLRMDNSNSPVPVLLITNSGAVCVNTSNATATGLTVQGNAYLSDTLVANRMVINSQIVINGTVYSNVDSNIFVDPANATNITSGTLNAARLATSGVTPGTYGSFQSIPIVSIDVAGRITSATSNPVVSSQWTTTTSNIWILNSNVGIGTTRPSTNLDVRGTSLFGTISITESGATAPIATFPLLSQNTAVGVGALASLTTGTNNTALGFNAGNDGLVTITSQNNIVVLGNNNSTGGLYCKSGTINTSDARDKVDIAPLAPGLDYIRQLQPVSYCWDDRGWYPSGQVPDGSRREYTRRVGFLAQDIQKVEQELGLPFDHVLVSENPDKLCIQPGNLVPILVRAVQELSAEVANLREALGRTR